MTEEPSPCPSGPGPSLQGLPGTPDRDQLAALPVPKSALIEWARAWWHTRGGAGRLDWKSIYERCLQSKFHSILTSGLVPGALVSTPPAPPGPLPSGVLSLCHFVILAQTLSTGEQHFLPLFLLPVGPLALSQKHSRALSILPGLEGGEVGRRGPQLGPPIVHQGPHPMSPTTPTLCPTGQPWPHNGATKFSLSAVSFQGPPPVPSDSPSAPLVGVGILVKSRPVLRQTCGYFFLIRLNLSTKHIFPHLLPTRDIPEMAGRKEGSERDRQTH